MTRTLAKTTTEYMVKRNKTRTEEQGESGQKTLIPVGVPNKG